MRQNGGHDIAAKGRPGLQQQVALGLDVKGGAVGGQAGIQGGGYPGDKGPAQVGGAGQDDFRRLESGQGRQGRGIRFFHEFRQGRVIHQVDFIGPAGDEFGSQIPDLVSEQDGGDGKVQDLGQTAAFSQKL